MNVPSESPAPHFDQHYSKGNIQFQYPGYFQLEEFHTNDEHSVTLLTESTSFWMVTLIGDEFAVEDVLESAIASYAEEYEELDIYDPDDQLFVGWSRQELDFSYQDLISSVVLLAKVCAQGTFLVIYQGQDQDLEQYRPVFDEVTLSIEL